MRISVVGAGYVGLVAAAGLAHNGYAVVCIDTDEKRVNSINRAILPLCEAGLDHLPSYCVRVAGDLKASTEYDEAPGTDITLICLCTPSNSVGSINLSHISDATRRVGKPLGSKKGYHVVVTRSTIIPGTTRDVIIPLLEKYSSKKVGEAIGVGYNPELLQEGKAAQAFFNPDRIIIGEVNTHGQSPWNPSLRVVGQESW